jgi:hypothetical protein
MHYSTSAAAATAAAATAVASADAAAALPYLVCGCGAAAGVWLVCQLPETRGLAQAGCLAAMERSFGEAEAAVPGAAGGRAGCLAGVELVVGQAGLGPGAWGARGAHDSRQGGDAGAQGYAALQQADVSL